MGETKAVIYDIKRYAIHDGPGIRTTVFFKGCPLSCLWCHNPEGMAGKQQILYSQKRCVGCLECLDVCPQGALAMTPGGITTDDTLCLKCGICCEQCPALAREAVARYKTVADVLALIRKDISFYEVSGGGVTFSGGEPLMQMSVLADLLKACWRDHIHTAVDTSGYAPWDVLEEILPFTRLFLYDLKIMDDDVHRRYTGVSNTQILGNLERLTQRGASVIVRMPLIPGINDSETAVYEAGTFIAGLCSTPAVEVIPYHDFQIAKYSRLGLVYGGQGITVPSPESIAGAVAQLEALGLTVKVH